MFSTFFNSRETLGSLPISYPIELEAHVNKLKECDEVLTDLFLVIKEKITLKVTEKGVSSACFRPDSREICLNPKVLKEKTFDNQIALIIFELNNAKNALRIQKIFNEIKSLSRNEFVNSIAKLEHETIISTSWFIQKLIKRSFLGEGTDFNEVMFRDFKRYFLYSQVEGGYVDAIANCWDVEHFVPRNSFSSWQDPLSSSDEKRQLAQLISCHAVGAWQPLPEEGTALRHNYEWFIRL